MAERGSSAATDPAAAKCRRWLGELLDPASRLELQICRYHRRRGAFDNVDSRVEGHLVTLGEQGAIVAVVDGREIRVGPGDALWISPGMVRRYRSAPEAPLARYWNLRFLLTRGRRRPAFLREPLLVRGAWDLRAHMQQLHDLFRHGHPYAAERLRGLVTALASGFMELAGDERRGDSGRTLSPAQRQAVDRYVVDHIGEGLRPEDLALEAGLSPDYFSRLFRRTYGASPREHLKRERSRLAAILLLETRLSVARVARRVGTDNVSLFCRQFNDVMGCAPGRYRRSGRPAPD